MLLQLEKQVSVAVWIQFIGQIMEAYYLSKIMLVSEEVRSDANERQILMGAWVQTAGQFLESIGTTKQILTDEEKLTLEAQEITNWEMVTILRACIRGKCWDANYPGGKTTRIGTYQVHTITNMYLFKFEDLAS